MAMDVIGRDEELASIEAFLGEVEQGPRALVLSGEAGIGKTILWEAGIDEARRSIGRVLTCRGVEAEASLSFAGLTELISPVLEETAPSLVPPRRRALEVALLLVEPGEDAQDPHAIGLAVLDVLRALAERGPVLVALDDAQWLDASSAGVLQIALRRLREEPIGVLATLRTTPETGAVFELERTFSGERLARVSLGPLSLGALHHLLRERIGLELTRPELARVQEATAGNPFFALEFGRELVRTGTRPAPGQALKVPESLRELLGGRLARLPAETMDVLLQAAALARPTVDLVAATYGDRERVLEAIESAVREGVVELDDSRVAFVHPLVASICYEQAPIWKRRAVHRALAGAVSDLEERARHLALASDGPDSAVASELDTAAEHAAARGATAAAAELFELAAELTPADPVRSRRRRLNAARFYRIAGDVERSVPMLKQLRDETPSGVERADVLFELAMTQLGSSRELLEQCDEALAEASSDDARASRILAVRAGHHLIGADVQAALADIRAALDKAERVGDPALLAQAIAYAGQSETYSTEITPGLLERGVEIEERLGLELEWNLSPRYALARRLMRLGEIDRTRTILEEMETRALERGDEGSGAMILWPLAMLEWLAGRWQRALEHSAAAYELTVQTQHPHARFWVGRAKALIEADLGLVDEARASAGETLALAQAGSILLYGIVAEGVLGRLELAAGNLEGADGYLRELPERLLAGGMNDPTFTVWADAIETLIALGELEQAAAYLAPYEANAARLGSPWARTRYGPLPRPARSCGGRPGSCVLGVRALPGRCSAVPARARTHAPLPRHGTQAGAAEASRAGGARAGARDLRGAGRAPVGGESTGRAQADQWPAGVLRRADRDRAPRRRARRPGPYKQGDRGRALHGREHGRGPPLARLPQARDPLTDRALRGPRRDGREPSRGVSAMPGEIIGREEELARIEAFLADVENGPGALVLSGEAGIGKTILWETGVDEARKGFGRVLTCRGVEAEALLSFAALSDLLGVEVVERAAPSLAAPRRRALEIALRLVEPGDDAPDTHTIGLAILDVLRVLAEQGPVLVALDDLQWLDPSSAGVLQVAFRRLRDEPIGVLATLRTAADVVAPFELERTFPEERLERLELRPLSLGAVHSLLEERLGLELTRPELARVYEATAGNPFFALELGRELVRTDTRPSPGQPLRVPESLRELLGGRLARLHGDTLDVLLQIAALARPTIDLVVVAYGDREPVLDALEEAVREGVVVLDDADVRFAHPLLASICYERAPLWKRRAVHRTLADAVSDVEERARHLALAAEGPDRAIAAELDTAAERAAARGATAAAAELSELAAELTPDDPARARQRRLRAANLYRVASDTERAVTMFRQLLTEVSPGVERADVLFALASTFETDIPTLIELCDEALAEAADDDGRSSRILSFRSLGRLQEANTSAALADAREALKKAERVGDPTLIAVAIAKEGHAEMWAGEVTPGLLERGAEIEERFGLELEYRESPRLLLARRLMRAGEIERPRAILEESQAKAAARGDEVTRLLVLWYLSMLEWLAGNLQQALEYAAAAHETPTPTTPTACGRDVSRPSSRRIWAWSTRRVRRPRRESRTHVSSPTRSS